MAFDQTVGLRISREPGAVPTAAQIGEGELAFNLTDGRIFALLAGDVVDITDGYSRAQVDQLTGDLGDRLDDLAIGDIAGLFEALAGKVNKESGKGLSSNDYTSAEKSKLAAAGTMANRDIHVAERAPTTSDGADGDLWFQY